MVENSGVGAARDEEHCEEGLGYERVLELIPFGLRNCGSWLVFFYFDSTIPPSAWGVSSVGRAVGF